MPGVRRRVRPRLSSQVLSAENDSATWHVHPGPSPAGTGDVCRVRAYRRLHRGGSAAADAPRSSSRGLSREARPQDAVLRWTCTASSTPSRCGSSSQGAESSGSCSCCESAHGARRGSWRTCSRQSAVPHAEGCMTLKPSRKSTERSVLAGAHPTPSAIQTRLHRLPNSRSHAEPADLSARTPWRDGSCEPAHSGMNPAKMRALTGARPAPHVPPMGQVPPVTSRVNSFNAYDVSAEFEEASERSTP